MAIKETWIVKTGTMDPDEAGEKIRALEAENARFRKAITGWSGYAWKSGEYVDSLEDYFDEVLRESKSYDMRILTGQAPRPIPDEEDYP